MATHKTDPAMAVSVVTLPAVGGRIQAESILTTADGRTIRLSPEACRQLVEKEKLVVVTDADRRQLAYRPAVDTDELDRPMSVEDRRRQEAGRILARQQALHGRSESLARETAPLLARSCEEAATWWNRVSQANGHKIGLLLKLVRGLRQLDRRHRAGGGLLAVDWINEARTVASDAGLLDPADWLDRIERRHLFEEQ
jgi:hypothetical protein